VDTSAGICSTSFNQPEHDMNIAKNMEAVFIAATLLLCTLTYSSNDVAVTDPGPASVGMIENTSNNA
jgi:hypothetical protein